ncbi:D-glucuronyl C5-epimerase family protein [Devosia sp. ZB163]|uniref:D-glucuronyl C5-epimerase family protein n=1 Tax=Devosia sp. ZB163 TaxID=3025938 RepID=UPI0023602A10|nr:D-glucuronyl C5-epimerase family protein [Devosia sp. ZB163]MDC9823041.1 D-glucuronyl C5-epimerase family protein [Devosia sp. ZB163]
MPILVAALAISALTLAWWTSSSPAPRWDALPVKQSSSVVDVALPLVAPFFWFYPTTREVATDWEAMTAKGDPLRVAEHLYRRLYDYARTGDPELGDDARAGVDTLLKWPNVLREGGQIVRWNYDFDYEDLKSGWWSGMDGFATPLALYAASEVLEDVTLRTLALAALRQAIKSPTAGGSIWRDASGCWLSEFSWPNMSVNDEYFVLNGHLYGMQALYLLASATQDPELVEAYQCAVAGTRAKADAFNAIPDWSLYMLNEASVSPPHYVIFESVQLSSLAALTGEKLFTEMQLVRQRDLALQYPVHAMDDGKLLFSHVGAPHPYLLDTYPVSLECKLPNGELWRTESNFPHRQGEEFLKRAFIVATPPAPPSSCKAISDNGVQATLFEMPPLPERRDQHATLTPTVSVAFDAVAIDDRTVTVAPLFSAAADPAHYTSTRANIALETEIPISTTSLFGIEVSPSRDIAIGITVEDDHGTRATRYYPGLRAGETSLVLLSKVGFPKYESLTDRLSKLTIHVWTDPENLPDQGPFEMELGNVVTFGNTLALYRYLVDSGSVVPQGQ